MEEALQIADFEVGYVLAGQRTGGEDAAGGAHRAAAAPQAGAAEVALAFRAGTLPLEHAELHRAALARHLTAAASHYHRAYAAYTAYSTPLRLDRSTPVSRQGNTHRDIVVFIIIFCLIVTI